MQKCDVKGFTLLEMLVTLSIIAVMSALVFPVYTSFFSTAKSDVASAQLLRALAMTRSEAWVHGKVITLCGSRDHITCTGDWTQGQIIFIDENHNGTVPDKQPVLYVFAGFSSALLHWRSSLNRDYVSITPSGQTDAEDGTFWYCENSAKLPAWAIRINQAGRARLQYPDHQGKIANLACA
jgi:type IV fimbrial biogenesis protein FimT